MYLLDTNIVSELARRQPNQGVVDFMKSIKQSDDPVYLSAMTIGEITKGIDKLAHHGDQDQADKFRRWLSDLKREYADCVLSVDSDVSELWGSLLAITDETNAIDKLIAATALLYDLTLVTRNIEHVSATGVVCINPFT